MDNSTIVGIASVGEGVFWILAYFLIIRRGMLDKSFGMPIIAVCGNIAWEFIMVFFLNSCPAQDQNCNKEFFFIRGLLVALLDAGIAYTIWRYAPSQFKNEIIKKNIRWMFLVGIVIGAILVYGIETTFWVENIHNIEIDGQIPQFLSAKEQGGLFSGWVLEFNMDILLVFMIINRGNISGQSLYIALFKTIGTIFAYILSVGVKQNVPIIDWLFWITLVFNLVYIYLIYTYTRAAGINPWRRF